MNEVKIEVCAGSYEDCLAAARGGADRVELNSALALGGLSPTETTLKQVKQDTDLGVICMVRPRGAGFCYTNAEKKMMLAEAESFMKNGADGIAFGFLTADGAIDVEPTKKMITLIHQYGGEAVFHRAVDVTPDYDQAVETLCDLGADRVLTSGQFEKAVQGLENIARIQKKYGNRIQILAGSGVNASNGQDILAATGIHQLHSSCKGYDTDPTTSGEKVTYAYLEGDHRNDYDVVKEELVDHLVRSVKA